MNSAEHMQQDDRYTPNPDVGAPSGWISKLRNLYEGDTLQAHRFRYGLLMFDVMTVLFIVVTSFLPRSLPFEAVGVLFGIGILLDVSARVAICPQYWRVILNPFTLVDLIAVTSFLAPITGEAAGFLRVLRTLRLLHSYQLLARLRTDSPFFRRNEEVIVVAVNLAVFIFVTTAVVYEIQHWTNESIKTCRCPLF